MRPTAICEVTDWITRLSIRNTEDHSEIRNIQHFNMESSSVDFSIGMTFYVRPEPSQYTARSTNGAPDQKTKMHHDIASTLHSAGLDAIYQTKSEDDTDRTLFWKPIQGTNDPEKVTERNGGKYWIVSDFLNFGNVEVSWIPVEVRSPVAGEALARDGYRDITKALDTIKSTFGQGLRLNKACRLSVYISVEQDSAVDSIKRLVTLVSVLDAPLLYSLISSDRRTALSPLLSESRFARFPIRCWKEDRLRNADPDSLSPDFVAANGEKLACLWNAPTLADLNWLLGRIPILGPEMGLGLVHEHIDGVRVGIIQFSHAQASFNVNFVKAWLDVVLRIAKAATLPMPLFSGLVDKIWSETMESTEDTNHRVSKLLNWLERYTSGLKTTTQAEAWQELMEKMRVTKI